jgi:hypothetical protein
MSRSGKFGLAAAGLLSLLLLAGCGKEEESTDQAASNQAATDAIVADQAEPAAEPAPLDPAPLDPTLAAEIQKATEEYLALTEGPEKNRVLSHKSVAVALDGDAFAVTIGGLRVSGGNQRGLEIGDVTYRVRPKGADLLVASDLGHAAEFPFIGADGKPAGSLKMTTKHFSAEYSKSLKTFLTFDWQVADSEIIDKSAGMESMRIDGMGFTIASEDKGGGLYDQNGGFTMEGSTFTELSGEAFLIGAVKGAYALKSVRLKEYVEKSQAMQDRSMRKAPRRRFPPSAPRKWAI